jgi:hypothetical protein
MALEELTQYVAHCDGPSDLGSGCPDRAKFEDGTWGDDRYYDDTMLAQDMNDQGWYIQMSEYGNYPKKYAEVMCPKCKEVAGE